MARILILTFLLLPLLAAASPEHSPEQEKVIQSILGKEQILLEDLFRLADLSNPTLSAAKHEVLRRSAHVGQVGLFPNPGLEYEVGELSESNPESRKEKVSLSLPLILGSRRKEALESARASRDAAVHAHGSTRREIHRSVHDLWAEQLFFRETGRLFEDLLLIANSTLKIARTRFESRAAPESQVTRALLEVYELEVAEQQMQEDALRSSAELSALLGGIRIPLDRLSGDFASDMSFGQETATGEFPNQHPRFRSAQRGVDAAEASLREARAARIPDLELSLALERNQESEEDFLEFGVSLPLPLFNRNQWEIAEAAAALEQTRMQALVLRNELLASLEVARKRQKNLQTRLQTIEDRILPAAERGLVQAQEGYRIGHLPFLELIDAQNTLASTRLKTLELRKDLLIAGAELQSLLSPGPFNESGFLHE